MSKIPVALSREGALKDIAAIRTWAARLREFAAEQDALADTLETELNKIG